MLILGDRVFESTLCEGDRVSLRETTLEEGTGEFGGDILFNIGAKWTFSYIKHVAVENSYYSHSKVHFKGVF